MYGLDKSKLNIFVLGQCMERIYANGVIILFSIKINKNLICYNLLHKMEIMIPVVMRSAITYTFKGNMIEFTI